MGNQCLAKLFSTHIGIDLGTANCLVYVRDHGIVLNEPSFVAIKKATHEVLAVGNEAKKMWGKFPSGLEGKRPLQDGVIADFEVTEEMLRIFIQKALRTVPWNKRILHPRVLVAVPSGITEVGNRAVKDSAKRAGAGEVILVEEPMAAGLPVADPTGSMIVDIGGGTTEVAVISLSGIVSSKSVNVGGDELESAIIQHMKKVYNLHIGPQMAEEIKIKLGSVYPVKDDERMDVRGLDLACRVPKNVNVSAAEVRLALQEPITSIIEAVRGTLDLCPPDVAADLLTRGIMLAGGGALLCGLDKLLTEEIGLPVFVSEDPLNAVVKGTGVMLQEDNIWSN